MGGILRRYAGRKREGRPGPCRSYSCFGDDSDPEALGEQVAERLIADGAGAILDAVREYDGPLPKHE